MIQHNLPFINRIESHLPSVFHVGSTFGEQSPTKEILRLVVIVKLRIFLLQVTNATVSIHSNGKTAANLEQPAKSVRTKNSAAGTNP